MAALVAADRLTATDTGEAAEEQSDEEEVCWWRSCSTIPSGLSAPNNNRCFVCSLGPQFQRSRSSPHQTSPEEVRAGSQRLRLRLTRPALQGGCRRQVRNLSDGARFSPPDGHWQTFPPLGLQLLHSWNCWRAGRSSTSKQLCRPSRRTSWSRPRLCSAPPRVWSRSSRPSAAAPPWTPAR